MVGQDLCSPGNDAVHDLAVLGDLAGGVEVGEPSQRLVGPVEVFGLIQLEELLERVPRGSQDVDEPRRGDRDASGGRL